MQKILILLLLFLIRDIFPQVSNPISKEEELFKREEELISKEEKLKKEKEEFEKQRIEFQNQDKTKKEIVTKDEDFFKLEEKIGVTVASKKKETLEEVAGAVTVYTAKQIRDLGFQNLTEILHTIPGFYIHTTQNQISKLRVRGFRNSLLILIDGVPMIQANQARDLESLPISIGNIKRIETMRSPNGVVWGADAFVGIINIVTKDVDDMVKKGKNSGYTVDMRYGNWDTKKFYLNSGSRLTDKLSMYLGGAYETTTSYPQRYTGTTTQEGYQPYQEPSANIINAQPIGQGISGPWYRPESELRKNPDYTGEILLKTIYKPTPAGELRTSILMNQNKNYNEVSAYGAQLGRNNNGYYEYPFIVYNAHYSHQVTNHLTFQMTISRSEAKNWKRVIRSSPFISDTNLSNQNQVRDSRRNPSPNRDGEFDYEGNYNEVMISNYADTNFSYTGLSRNSILAGFTYLEQRASPQYFGKNTDFTQTPSGSARYGSVTDQRLSEYLKSERQTSRILSAYVQDEIKIFQSLSLLIGGRLDDRIHSGRVFNPRGSLIYKPFEKLIFKYLYTRGFREPNFEALYAKTKIVGSETYNGVNPDPTDPNSHAPYKLEPEKSQAHEGQIFYNILPDLRANINLAHTKVSGLINTYYDNGRWRWRRNLGEQVANTIEFELQKNFYSSALGLEPGSFIYFNSTYNDTYRISSELNARTTFEDNSLGRFMRSEGIFYPVGTKLKMTELPQKWMNFGGYIRFLERWGFNYNLFAASERRVGGYKGFEENADPDQRKIGVGIKKYPENYKEEILAAAACSYSSEPIYNCRLINNGNYQYRLSPYYTLDLGMHYETIFQDDQKLRLSIQVKNVFNRLYSEADQTTTGRILPNFQPGRNIIISLLYQF